jgi:hypothetical protein
MVLTIGNHYIFQCLDLTVDILYRCIDEYKITNQFKIPIDSTYYIKIQMPDNDWLVASMTYSPYFSYKFVLDYPDFNWAHPCVLQNSTLTENELLDICIKNKSKLEEYTTLYGGGRGIEKNPIYFLTLNSSITENFIYKLVNLKFNIKYNYFLQTDINNYEYPKNDYRDLFISEKLVDFFNINNIEINYGFLSKHPNISIKYILKNRFKSWDYNLVSKNPNLTESDILNYPDMINSKYIISNHFTYNPYIYNKHMYQYIKLSPFIICNLSNIVLSYL